MYKTRDYSSDRFLTWRSSIHVDWYHMTHLIHASWHQFCVLCLCVICYGLYWVKWVKGNYLTVIGLPDAANAIAGTSTDHVTGNRMTSGRWIKRIHPILSTVGLDVVRLSKTAANFFAEIRQICPAWRAERASRMTWRDEQRRGAELITLTARFIRRVGRF